MKTPIKLLLAVIITSLCSQATAQESISEEEMPFTVLKWFYDQYPNTAGAIWNKDEREERTTYTSSFEFKEKKYKTTYNSKGKRIVELMYLESTPINLTNFLHDRFGQFKLKKVAQKTIFPSGKVSYVAKIKSKEEGVQEVEYDEHDESSSTNANQIAVSDN